MRWRHSWRWRESVHGPLTPRRAASPPPAGPRGRPRGAWHALQAPSSTELVRARLGRPPCRRSLAGPPRALRHSPRRRQRGGGGPRPRGRRGARRALAARPSSSSVETLPPTPLALEPRPEGASLFNGRPRRLPGLHPHRVAPPPPPPRAAGPARPPKERQAAKQVYGAPSSAATHELAAPCWPWGLPMIPRSKARPPPPPRASRSPAPRRRRRDP